MSEVTQENINFVLNALVDFYNSITVSRKIALNDFTSFMEPKFAEAGYRSPQTLTEGGNILIIHDTGAGDLITQSGAVREIRRIYPDAHITMIVSPYGFELAECCPYVDEMIVNEQQHKRDSFLQGYKWNLNLAKRLLERRYDICYAFIHHPATPTLMYMSGAKVRITHAFADDREAWNEPSDVPLRFAVSLATHNYPMFTYGNHIVNACFSLLDHSLNMPVTNRSIEAWYSAFDFAKAQDFLLGRSKPFYALCMGGSGFRKHYPPENYAKLLQMILNEEPNATFVILGGSALDEQSAETLKNSVPEIYNNNVVDLTNKLKYRQSAAALSLCDMYIGNDTGTMHAATAVKCPVLMTSCFAADLERTHTDIPLLWYPYNVPSVIVQPEHALPECRMSEPYMPYGCRTYEPHCITQITPEKLFEGFKLLKQRIEHKNIEPLYIN